MIRKKLSAGNVSKTNTQRKAKVFPFLFYDGKNIFKSAVKAKHNHNMNKIFNDISDMTENNVTLLAFRKKLVK